MVSHIGYRSEHGILRLYVGDLHMHTTYSHGANTPLEMALASRNLGFDFIAIAEHNTVRASKDARDLVEKYSLNLLVFLAEEVGSSPSAHILGIGIREDIPSGMSPEETCREIRRQGGYVFAAHPNWGLRGPRTPFWELGLFESLLAGGELDGFELVNSTKYASTHMMAGSEHTGHVVEKYRELQSRGLHFPIISGSDAHSVEELGGTKTFVFAAELGETPAIVFQSGRKLWAPSLTILPRLSLTVRRFFFTAGRYTTSESPLGNGGGGCCSPGKPA